MDDFGRIETGFSDIADSLEQLSDTVVTAFSTALITFRRIGATVRKWNIDADPLVIRKRKRREMRKKWKHH